MLGAECSDAGAVVWACVGCASDAGAMCPVLAVGGACLHGVLITSMCFDPKLLIGQASLVEALVPAGV